MILLFDQSICASSRKETSSTFVGRDSEVNQSSHSDRRKLVLQLSPHTLFLTVEGLSIHVFTSSKKPFLSSHCCSGSKNLKILVPISSPLISFSLHIVIKTQRISIALPTSPVKILHQTVGQRDERTVFLSSAKCLWRAASNDRDSPPIRTGLDINLQARFSSTSHSQEERIINRMLFSSVNQSIKVKTFRHSS